jgi:7,8-dihydroneopterin aldolase/epimerase/oxygenase
VKLESSVELTAARMPTAERVIRLQRLKVMASIGVLAHELTTMQAVLFDAELVLSRAGLQPDATRIDSVLDYRQVRSIIIEEAQRQHIALVEALVDRIAVRLLQMEKVISVRLAAYKPQAFDDCDAVGVEVFVQR